MPKTLVFTLLMVILLGAITSCTADNGPVKLSPSISPGVSSVEGLVTPETLAAGQQEIVDEIITELKQRGVPVESARIVNSSQIVPPKEIEFTLRSASNNSKETPEDAIYTALVFRAGNLAQNRGLDIGSIGIILINTEGQEILRGASAIEANNNLSLFSPPFHLADAAVTDLLEGKISLDAPAIIVVKVFAGIEGLREVVFDIQMPDIQAANNNIGVVSRIEGTIRDLNADQDAQVSAYQINITDPNGNPLLKYMNDLMEGGGRITSWEAEGLANWGYPSGPPDTNTTPG